MDLNLIKQKLLALQNKSNNKQQDKDKTFWKLNEGEHTVRIVPTKDGDPFKDYFFHYKVGKNNGFLCPKKNFGEDCSVCKFVSDLYKQVKSNPEDKDTLAAAKDLTAKQRFFSPVYVRGEEDQGIRVWGYGKTAYETILNLILNPDYGDITDQDKGTDLTITCALPQKKGAFPTTKISPRRKTSPLCTEGSKKCKELLETVPDIASLFERKSSAEVKVMLEEYLLSDQDAESNSTEVNKYGSKNTSNNSKEEKEPEVEDVDKAFKELLNS